MVTHDDVLQRLRKGDSYARIGVELGIVDRVRRRAMTGLNRPHREEE